MSNPELSEENRPPKLLLVFSKCSEFSEIDLENKQSPKILKLRKLNSAIDNNDQLHLVINKQIDIDEKKQESPINESSKWQPCSCTKTYCLKMYCSCFHNGQICGESCKCEDCKNTNMHFHQRDEAVEYIKKKAHRNKKVPQEKLFETKDIWGCNCKKTRCLKRYCECYIRQKTCTVECNCNHCENGKDEDLYNEIRRQNEQPQQSRRQRTRRQDNS
ncbi:unnamed protein product (macronuclear) [Paramecium tetraurelia]|uniref:CRC domain-containing protein n=1 Tax=Paramecium tetraurelia TaxID=5888 RepID=A0D313_PARTE|nr:uncharacterized protein GSPATT00012915001 [Paramecium tetraurelia]CAK77430.1 unnamed protein product [Paramecium tetraurelia]|eukprot:XP_001444827.1 hypothetical protein (macronuclear) [Paramecium tetraurelia strain d4-2]